MRARKSSTRWRCSTRLRSSRAFCVQRGATFANVVCRVSPNYALDCHLDFDEGNAVGIRNGSFGEIIRK